MRGAFSFFAQIFYFPLEEGEGGGGAERGDFDPERRASSLDRNPLSSIGSSGDAVSWPLGADCLDGSPGILGPEVRGGWPRL